MAPEDALACDRMVNVVLVREEAEEEAEEQQNPSAAAHNVSEAIPSTRSEYARRMVPPEPVSICTSHLGDGQKVKTTIYRRRSNSLE